LFKFCLFCFWVFIHQPSGAQKHRGGGRIFLGGAPLGPRIPTSARHALSGSSMRITSGHGILPSVS
jgi:hypothetical protein